MNDSTAAEIQRFAADRRVRPATVARWLELPTDDAIELLALATELRLGENQLADLWTWADEVAKRDGASLAAVLTKPEIASARRRQLGRNDRLHLVKQELRRQRFPQLTAMEDKLLELVRQLGLPPTIRVELPAGLEGDALQFQFRIGDAKALKAVAEELLRVAASPAFAEILSLLEEAP